MQLLHDLASSLGNSIQLYAPHSSPPTYVLEPVGLESEPAGSGVDPALPRTA